MDRKRLDALRQWLTTGFSKLWRKPDKTAPIRYVLSPWGALTRNIENPHIEIVQRLPNALYMEWPWARKSYLFAGSDAGGQRDGATYSLIGSAKFSGRDPEADLREAMTRIADQSTRSKSCCPRTSIRVLPMCQFTRFVGT